MLGIGKAPHANEIVTAGGAVIVGKATGLTVIIRETAAIVLPQISVAVQVSVTIPPQIAGVAEKVELTEVPLNKQPLLKPLLKEMVLDAGKPPQATVIVTGAVIAGKAAGLTVIILETAAIVLPQISVAVHVSVTIPPQAAGVVEKVELSDVPLNKQASLNPLLKEMVLDVGKPAQATVIDGSAAIVGKAAGLTVIIC